MEQQMKWLNSRVERPFYLQIKIEAAKVGLSVSEFVRLAVREKLDSKKPAELRQ